MSAPDVGPPPAGPEAPPPHRPPLWLSGVLGLAVLVGLGAELWSSQYVVASQAQVMGQLHRLAPLRAGVVARVLVQEGEALKPGQVVAELEAGEAEAQLRQAEALVAAAQARLAASGGDLKLQEAQSLLLAAQAQAQLRQAQAAERVALGAEAQARANHARLQGLARQGIVSAMELDAARQAILSAEGQARQGAAQRQEAEAAWRHALASRGEEQVKREGQSLEAAQLAHAQAQLALAQGQRAACQVRAQVAGVVVRRLKAPGEGVAAGEALISYMGHEALWVEGSVGEAEAVRLHLGAKAVVRVDAWPQRRWGGQLSFLAPATAEATNPLAPSPSPGALRLPGQVPFRLRLEPGPEGLQPGQHATVRLDASAPLR